MPFFQNPFSEDFEGNWVLGDRHHVPKFVVKANAGRGAELVASWNEGPYDLSGNDADGNARSTLKISFCLHNNKNWATLSVDVTTQAASAAAVSPAEVVASLLANAIFAERFEASLGSYNNRTNPVIKIRQKKPITEFRFYIVNGQAEEAIGFNARAGVAELPSYFSRHTLANRFTYDDSQGHLIELNPANNVDAAVINNAVDVRGVSLGYSSSDVSADWELLAGRSGLFQFTKGPSTNAVASTETVIIYPTGAKVGDLAKKIITQKDASSVVVAEYEIPYTLTNSDLVTPP